MKLLLSPKLRLMLRVLQRGMVDRASSQFREFVHFSPLQPAHNASFQPEITLAQALLNSSHSENKKHNLKLAIQRIQNVTIAPRQIFSFWHLVGKPDAAKGYLEGRAIINNQLQTDFGGGLCQLSGLIYFLALKANLEILERHPHSKDIYTEETRFAPLGSDATLVYGYKDLRFRNNLTVPICLRFTIAEQQIAAWLCAPAPIVEFELDFKVRELATAKTVDTIRRANATQAWEVIQTTTYKK